MAQTIVAYAGSNGWTVRLDAPHGNAPNAQRHVHITRRKLGGEYSWNIDGSRHDRHRFPLNEKCIKRAKEIAASRLRIPITALQLATAFEGGARITVAETGRKPGEPFTYRSHVGVDYYIAIFLYGDDLVLVTNSYHDARDA